MGAYCVATRTACLVLKGRGKGSPTLVLARVSEELIPVLVSPRVTKGGKLPLFSALPITIIDKTLFVMSETVVKPLH